MVIPSLSCSHQADTLVGRMLTMVLVFLLKTTSVSRSVSVVVEDDSGNLEDLHPVPLREENEG